MSKKIYGLIVTLILVTIVSYLFYYNPQNTAVHFGSDSFVELPLALSLIISFFLGVLFVSIVGLFIGIKFKYQQWKLNRQVKQQNDHYNELTKAYDLLSLRETEQARNILRNIVSKDPSDIMSRISLAKTFSLEGKINEALKILEEARAEVRRSPALLVTIAETQIVAGNKTAAHDSLLLALREYPKNIFLLEKAIDLSRELGKLGDAKFLADELLRVSPYAKQSRISELLALIELEEIQPLIETDPDTYRSRLYNLTKNHKDFIPAIIQYAELLINNKEHEQAIKLLKKAALKNHSSTALERLVNFWIRYDNPSEAISILKQACESEDKDLVLSAKVLLAQTLLNIENPDEALKEINYLEEQLENDKSKSLFLLALKAKLDARTLNKTKSIESLDKILIEEAHSSGLPVLLKDKPIHNEETKLSKVS